MDTPEKNAAWASGKPLRFDRLDANGAPEPDEGGGYPTSVDGAGPVGELIEADAPSPLDQAIESERDRKVEAALSALSARERVIVAMRFGIGYQRQHSLQQIGAVVGISRERVRQLLGEILEKLVQVRSLRELHDEEDW